MSGTGLRERKRLAAMRRLQEVALDLFDERGYDGVTVEVIAAAAEVSPSSVYRYFGSKEQLVLHDEFDLQLLDVLATELAAHPAVEAVRRAVSSLMLRFFGRDEELSRRKIRYWMEEPAVQAAAARQTEQFTEVIAAHLAQAVGRPPDDLEVRVVAVALVSTLVAAARHWYLGGFAVPLDQVLQQALTVLENGLRLD